MDRYITELRKVNISKNDISLVVDQEGETKTATLIDFAEMVWDRMYINVKKVVITCSYCGSANSITNSNCIQCGAGLGKDIQGDKS